MKVWLTLFLFLAPLTLAHTASAATWPERREACRKFLKMGPAQQAKIARPTGYSAAAHKKACRQLLAGKIREEKNEYTGPAWAADRYSCTTSRECSGTESCIGRRCKPASYGGCGSGTDSCPAGESCVNGACR